MCRVYYEKGSSFTAGLGLFIFDIKLHFTLLKWLNTANFGATRLAIVICLFHLFHNQWNPKQWPENDGTCHDADPCGSCRFCSSPSVYLFTSTIWAICQHYRASASNMNITWRYDLRTHMLRNRSGCYNCWCSMIW